MRITSKGQVTIPIAIREQAGFLPETEVEFVMEGGAVKIIKATGDRGAGRRNDIVDYFREGRKRWRTTGMSADEVMALTRDWELPENDAAPTRPERSHG